MAALRLRYSRLTILFVFSACFAASHADEPKPAPLTALQRRDIQAATTDFRAGKKNNEKRAAAVDKANEVGPAGSAALLDVVNKELQPQLGNYRDRFFAQATTAAIAKAKAANPQEIAALRKLVNDLSQQPGLTKEMIVRQSDLAMKRLTELLVLDRRTVLDAAPAFIKQRDAMQELGAHWERLVVALAKADAASPAGPSTDAPAALPTFEAYLCQEEELAVQLAVPTDNSTRNVLATNARSLAPQLDPEEARCTLALNLTRNLLGLPPLVIDLKLATAARGHSADMEARKFFDHESPVPGKATPWDRAKLAGTTASGENIAMGTLEGTLANQMWWHSPGHHKNMLGDHVRVGLGRNGRYWTELFGK